MNYVPALDTLAISERASWQYRLIKHTRGNQTILGAFIVAMFGRKVNPPCFHPGGIRITKDGQVLALFLSTNPYTPWQDVVIFPSVQEMRKMFLQTTDELKFNAVEVHAVFDELRKFVRVDERAVSVL